MTSGDDAPLTILIRNLFRAFAYIGIEAVIPKLFTDTLGNAFYVDPYFRQLAAIGGAPFGTFTLVLVNLALYETYIRIRDRGEPSIWPAFKKTSIV